ncbi:MAG: hypothetical protein JO319_05245 [Acidobacteriaceae bacterium]|nr:hypothetical protein [Acidobacteriaceae bacterium]
MHTKRLSCLAIACAAAALSPAIAQNVAPSPPPSSALPTAGSTPADNDPNAVMNRALSGQTAGPAVNFNQVIDRAINNEHVLSSKLRDKEPVIETYIQQVKKDSDLGYVPTHDFYFLGKLNMEKGIVDDSFLPKRSTLKAIPHVFTALFTTEYYSGGFADQMFLDPTNFDRAHYKFQYVRREFLGNVRCYVADITPQEGAGKRRFEGRIWIEDQVYNIVRFNGRYVPSPSDEFTHFDSWRVNSGTMWLPTYVYAQDEGYRWGPVHSPPMRAQTRLWNYEPSRDRAQQAFTELTVNAPTGVTDNSQAPQAYSPVQEQRMWQEEAEENIVDRLQNAGLVAPRGEVDRVLDTVLNNIEVTNNINLDPPAHARVLLTTPLESVAVNDSILISRGLIDVLPDEASLAAVLAQGLAHIILSHGVDTRYAFSDRLLFDDPQVLKKIQVARTQQEEQDADAKAIQLLKNSPYADKLPQVGLFLRMLSARSNEVPHLIKPLIGNRMADTHKDLRLSGLMEMAPELQVRNVNQISALPLGSRIKVNPWSDQLSLLKAQNVALVSAKEKMPFQITPFIIYLTRDSDSSAPPHAADQNVPVASTAPAPPNR